MWRQTKDMFMICPAFCIRRATTTWGLLALFLES